MRRLLIFCLILASISLHAQEEKPGIQLNKNWLLGGNGQLYMEKIGSQTGRLVVVLEPQASYFLTNSIALGIRLPLSYNIDRFIVRATPFLRYYFPVKGTVLPFLELNGGYQLRIVFALVDDSPNTLVNSWIFGGRAGGAFFLNKNISIDLFTFYTGENTKANNGSEPILIQYLGLGAGFVVYLD